MRPSRSNALTLWAEVNTSTPNTQGRGKPGRYHARLGKPFLHDAYMSELTTLRDELKWLRNRSPPASDSVIEAAAAPQQSSNSSGIPVNTFQERVILERQNKNDGQSPS